MKYKASCPFHITGSRRRQFLPAAILQFDGIDWNTLPLVARAQAHEDTVATSVSCCRVVKAPRSPGGSRMRHGRKPRSARVGSDCDRLFQQRDRLPHLLEADRLLFQQHPLPPAVHSQAPCSCLSWTSWAKVRLMAALLEVTRTGGALCTMSGPEAGAAVPPSRLAHPTRTRYTQQSRPNVEGVWR